MHKSELGPPAILPEFWEFESSQYPNNISSISCR